MGYTIGEEYSESEAEKTVTTASGTSDGAVSESDAELSVRKEKKKQLHKCTYKGCDKSFWKPSRLLWHLRQHTGERPYKCDFENCGKAYTTSSHLKRHARSHNTIQQSVKCDACKLTLKNRDNYRKHYQRVHNNKNRISCDKCDIVFRKKHKLEEHMAMHNKELSFQCKKCDKIFTTIYLLKKHEKIIHNRILKCTENNCNEEFFRFIDLRIHRKKKHPKEYRCEQCNKCFFNKSKLKQHSQSHELSLLSCPYDECSKVYSFKRNLQHHINTKHLGTVYYCDMCGIGVSSKPSIIRHIKNIHFLKKPKNKKRIKIGSERLRRKDAGLPRKSMAAKLTGLDLPLDIEKIILNRTTELKFSDCTFDAITTSDNIDK